MRSSSRIIPPRERAMLPYSRVVSMARMRGFEECRSSLFCTRFRLGWAASPPFPYSSIVELTFDHAHRPEASHFACQARVVNDFDHFIDILVSVGKFFENAVARLAAHEDTLCFQLLLLRARVAALLHSGAAHQ